MFDNQLLNLNMLPNNNQANLNKNLPQHGQTTLVNDNNNNNNNQNNIQNSRRRQLPLPPGMMTSKQSDNYTGN